MPEKPTICLLNDSFPPIIDGVANVVVNYASQIEMHYGRAVVATPAYPGAEDGAWPFEVVRYPSLDVRKLVGYMAGYPFSPAVARRLRETGTALLHTHCPVVSTMLARELRGPVDAPVVFTYHTKFDIDIAKAIRGRLLREEAVRALVMNIAACDEVWVVSRGAGENLRSLGYEGDMLVMENGVDVERGRADEAAVAAACGGYDLPAGVPVFLFVGRLMWYKGLRIILDALGALAAAGEDFRMVVVGDGADAAEIRAYAASLRLEDRCFFTGAISDRETLRAWYCRADLFLFPSTFDTNGLVVREAAACSLPAVLIRGSCAAEGVTDGRNGFLIDEDAPSMAAKLRELCAAPETVKTAGEAASRELYLSWADAVRKAADRYEIVLDGWQSGHYKKKQQPMDEFFRYQGELMDALGRIDGAVEKWSRWLAEGRNDFVERRREKRRELRDSIRETTEAVWQKLDRYL